jgi:phosphoglycolate phosphatase
VSVRVIYSDIDGTMVGPVGCFFRAKDRSFTLDPARALVRMHEAGISLVLVSGRTRAQLIEAAAIFGADGLIAELGAIVAWGDGRSSAMLRGAMPDGFTGVPDDLVAELCAHYPGQLELHRPWHRHREVDVMLRGAVDTRDAERWLAGRGFGWLRLRDNGLIDRASMPGLPTTPHVFHLVPAGVGKGEAVGFDLDRRGLGPDQAVAIGDSASDLAMARYVGRMHMVANALGHPRMAGLLAEHDNAVVEEGTLGAGWASAVLAAVADAGEAGTAAEALAAS